MFGLGFGYGFKSYGVSIGRELFEAYKARVIADGGVVENDACLILTLNRLNKV